MLNIYLLRHGQTAWNADGNRYCGRTDLPLTEKGLAQADAVSQQLKSINFDAVYASPLQRASQTAYIASGKTEVVTDERLIEADFGNWEGKTKEEFIAENQTLWTDWMNDPTNCQAGGIGETGKAVISRVDDFFRSLAERHLSGNVLVVAHNGVNRLYLAHKLGMPLKNYRKLELDNSAITQFTLDEQGELILKRLNSLL
ncbi:histidine phosphatase family protein [Pontibacter actiniarum]|uniref:Histidine phosphatase family protein n=1 Tax=Pontibacter actiniarum TaxID=323450 RepID=A0A1X9YT51_9BACT|nr:histidine phosphatase family protein [Pontibacter actiniarum]ARS35994.1 histidine phosphatase family protein [Pontibacter actiniarum]